jgi:hypothetical protein
MICLHCKKPFEPKSPKRPGKYCRGSCRAEASRMRRGGLPAVVRTVRVLKSGAVQMIIHIPPLWSQEAHVRQKGDNVRVGAL